MRWDRGFLSVRRSAKVDATGDGAKRSLSAKVEAGARRWLNLPLVAGAMVLGACSGESEREAPVARTAVAASERSAATPPNVVLIVVDTLRADHLSHYGYSRPTSEPLDRFRNRSTLFERAYSTAPWTGPSTMSIMTGLTTIRHRVNDRGDALAPEAVTLAERLSGAGYATHAISFNHIVSHETGLDQGFDEFDDFLGGILTYPDISVMARRVDRWVASKPRAPFFLYLQPMNVHGPYRVPKSRRSTLLGHEPSRAFEYWGKALMTPLMQDGRVELREQVTPEMVSSAIDQYDVAVRYSMEEIARMLDGLERAGLMDDTVVILTADHGEELFDHGGFSHGFSLHREVLHVPLYVHLPGQTEGKTVDRVVSSLDIVPTILALTGIENPGDLDGFDLFAPESTRSGERMLVQQAGWSERAKGFSLIAGQDHLIDLEHAYDTASPRLALYDVVADPKETRDRKAAEGDQAAQLRGELERRVAAYAQSEALPAPENVLDEMDVERLRALGYVE